MDEFIEILIDSEDIEKFLYKELIKIGYVPEEDEIQDLADIFFDYLISKSIVQEIDLNEE